jgi:hypothetical protein
MAVELPLDVFADSIFGVSFDISRNSFFIVSRMIGEAAGLLLSLRMHSW